MMRKWLFFLFLTTLSLGALAQGNIIAGEPLKETLVLKEPYFDFGRIPQGKPVTHQFELVNHSADSLKLQNVQASCGCTTPTWNKEPVGPGASTFINVGYNASAEGPFEKPVTIQYNNGQTKSIIIKGTVYKGPVNTVPTNASIQFLKQTNQ